MNETIYPTGEIKFTVNAPKLLNTDGKLYLDFSTIVELTGLPSTTCFRVLKAIKELPEHTLNYKNRIYYSESFILMFFRFGR